jgi:hypothetical protein
LLVRGMVEVFEQRLPGIEFDDGHVRKIRSHQLFIWASDCYPLSNMGPSDGMDSRASAKASARACR